MWVVTVAVTFLHSTADDEPSAANGGGPTDAAQSAGTATPPGATTAAKATGGTVQTATGSFHGAPAGGAGEAGAPHEDAAGSSHAGR